MDANKLFRVLVLGGAVLGTAAATRAVANDGKDPDAQKHSSKKHHKDEAPDAGQQRAKDEGGGGVQGW